MNLGFIEEGLVDWYHIHIGAMLLDLIGLKYKIGF